MIYSPELADLLRRGARKVAEVGRDAWRYIEDHKSDPGFWRQIAATATVAGVVGALALPPSPVSSEVAPAVSVAAASGAAMVVASPESVATIRSALVSGERAVEGAAGTAAPVVVAAGAGLASPVAAPFLAPVVVAWAVPAILSHAGDFVRGAEKAIERAAEDGSLLCKTSAEPSPSVGFTKALEKLGD